MAGAERVVLQEQGGDKPKIVLVLQGGGALGAYHIGAFEALHEAGYGPDWVTGISIGAFNAAIIAGNEPADRLDKLLGFWADISRPGPPDLTSFLPLQILRHQISSAEAMAFGQPDFFLPRLISPYLLIDALPDAISFYDTSALRETLPRFASFDRINRKVTRLTLGATNVVTGELEFFDNDNQTIGAGHVMASGSLPPGFPATEIDGQFYWDGACVSNTPLEALVAARGPEPMLVFVIDLFDAAGALPKTMNDVLWRSKQIQYASRAGHDLKMIEAVANHVRDLVMAQSEELPGLSGMLDKLERHQGRLDFVHITYRPGANQRANSDTDFSRASIAERRAAGRRDMKSALTQAPWTLAMPAEKRARIHPVIGGNG
jgi:NTE family protein